MTAAQTVVFGFSFIFLMTALGASLVFFFKKAVSPRVNAVLIGVAAGIMTAASVWSLLLPALTQAEDGIYGDLGFLPAAVGFMLGGLMLVALDKIVERSRRSEECPKPALTCSSRMLLAITVHNIPEGLAVGCAFGAAVAIGEAGAYASALGLAIGIGIQNFPEGASVALPLRSAGRSRIRSFAYGALSGIVEPIFAVVGFFLAVYVSALQPWLLAFAAGAMIFVVVNDLIPDAGLRAFPALGTWGIMFGFVMMMILDVALG